MARRTEEAPPAGAPAWMATFSDLMNLLLCFFVMLFAMSSIEEDKLREFVAAMNNLQRLRGRRFGHRRRLPYQQRRQPAE